METSLPAPAASEETPPGVYHEPLRWKEGMHSLMLTTQKEKPAQGVQLLDAGLPFSPEDLAALLARRPAALKRITIHASALRYDGATLKPLKEVLEHPSVKAEIERYRKDGGEVVMPR
jgi:hypothetical protein